MNRQKRAKRRPKKGGGGGRKPTRSAGLTDDTRTSEKFEARRTIEPFRKFYVKPEAIYVLTDLSRHSPCLKATEKGRLLPTRNLEWLSAPVCLARNVYIVVVTSRGGIYRARRFHHFVQFTKTNVTEIYKP